MRAADKEWLLKRLTGDDRVLAFRYASPAPQRGLLDWTLAFVFYAAIALVIMTWLWPLTRDLRQLESATASFGNRNWSFDPRIGVRSPVYRLAEAFRRMAARIDSLISSQKDMSNAMSHEIRTPLARMRFEIELARTAGDSARLAMHLNNLNGDIAELDNFVKATLDYAILDRAEMVLNLGEHDLTVMLPAVVESIKRDLRTELTFRCEVSPKATNIVCDAYLMETVVRNLLHNAVRYARGPHRRDVLHPAGRRLQPARRRRWARHRASQSRACVRLVRAARRSREAQNWLRIGTRHREAGRRSGTAGRLSWETPGWVGLDFPSRGVRCRDRADAQHLLGSV